MESLCIYILDNKQDLDVLIEMVGIAARKTYRGSFDIWLGFKGPNIKEVADFYNYKITKLTPVEAKNAFDKIIFLGWDNETMDKFASMKEDDLKEYSYEEIVNKLDTKKPKLVPYKIVKSRGDIDMLLDCYKEFKDDEDLLKVVNDFLKEINLED